MSEPQVPAIGVYCKKCCKHLVTVRTTADALILAWAITALCIGCKRELTVSASGSSEESKP